MGSRLHGNVGYLLESLRSRGKGGFCGVELALVVLSIGYRSEFIRAFGSEPTLMMDKVNEDDEDDGHRKHCCQAVMLLIRLQKCGDHA